MLIYYSCNRTKQNSTNLENKIKRNNSDPDDTYLRPQDTKKGVKRLSSHAPARGGGGVCNDH